MNAEDVRRLGVRLPEAVEGGDPERVGLSVRGKGFAWTFTERPEPRAPKEPVIGVLAIRCTAADKESLLAADPDKFFTTDHYRGFPAVLVRLDRVDEAELWELLVEGWRCQVPKRMAKEFDAKEFGAKEFDARESDAAAEIID
ncbi:MmcQ/YjbR family DNA-binding protein [Hamadaea tsunoensis]|uniref:MmcQ/YjbR family DNA-binding protein n=1 Tax=Hamadaea tsunoensis TaxID=53368 RepID=UPI00040D4E4B|nr:MmcQ/YjbR family DNA-binding protein [Hamadaea tsunoensis]